jgi:hypothetical protein
LREISFGDCEEMKVNDYEKQKTASGLIEGNLSFRHPGIGGESLVVILQVNLGRN